MVDRVLVVEDDAELRELLVEVLADAGYSAIGVPTAEAALRSLRGGEAPDLVLTDLFLPGMRGRELLDQLRALRPEINVIAITAFGSIDSAIDFVKAGAYDYLTKPFHINDLSTKIKSLLDKAKGRKR